MLERIHAQFPWTVLALLMWIGGIVGKSFFMKLRKGKRPDPYLPALAYYFSMLALWGPGREELVFRLAILLLFISFSPASISFNLLFSVLFGWLHYWDPPFRRSFLPKEEAMRWKGAYAFSFSFIIGCIALGTNSLGAALLFHAAWNSGQIFFKLRPILKKRSS